MRQDVIARQVGAMRAAGFDAVLSISPENFAYVTGFLSPTQPLMRWRHAMALVTADATVALAIVDMEASTIRAKSPPGTEIAVWREFQFDAMTVLAELLRKHGLANARIGIEMDYLPAGDLAALRDSLPQASFTAAQAMLARLREIKTPEEIDILRRLSRIADKAITDAYRSVRAGSSEMDLAAALTRGIYEQGAEYFKLMIVATGERSVYPNVGPTGRILKHGDVCRVEIFPIINGYHAGVCRTAAVGAPPISAAGRDQARCVEPRDLPALPRQGRRARPAADLLHWPWHRPAPARGPLSRSGGGSDARSRDGLGHRAADLRDRVRLRHAE
jgi:Xaa-Pro aminopeptidase